MQLSRSVHACMHGIACMIERMYAWHVCVAVFACELIMQNMTLLDLPRYLRHKLQNPLNLQLMRDYETNPDFVLGGGELWKHMNWEEIDFIPDDSAATQVSPINYAIN
jgi:hypothetical protein